MLVCVFVSGQMWVEQRLVEAGHLSAHMRHGSPPTGNKRFCPLARKMENGHTRHQNPADDSSNQCGTSVRASPTWPVCEVAAAEADDLHPLEEEHGGRDVRVQDMRPRLGRKWSVLRVQTETLALCVQKERDSSHKTQIHTEALKAFGSLIRWLTCCGRQLPPAPGLAFADWLDGDRVGSDPGVVNLQQHHHALTAVQCCFRISEKKTTNL